MEDFVRDVDDYSDPIFAVDRLKHPLKGMRMAPYSNTFFDDNPEQLTTTPRLPYQMLPSAGLDDPEDANWHYHLNALEDRLRITDKWDEFKSLINTIDKQYGDQSKRSWEKEGRIIARFSRSLLRYMNESKTTPVPGNFKGFPSAGFGQYWDKENKPKDMLALFAVTPAPLELSTPRKVFSDQEIMQLAKQKAAQIGTQRLPQPQSTTQPLAVEQNSDGPERINDDPDKGFKDPGRPEYDLYGNIMNYPVVDGPGNPSNGRYGMRRPRMQGHAMRIPGNTGPGRGGFGIGGPGIDSLGIRRPEMGATVMGGYGMSGTPMIGSRILPPGVRNPARGRFRLRDPRIGGTIGYPNTRPLTTGNSRWNLGLGRNAVENTALGYPIRDNSRYHGTPTFGIDTSGVRNPAGMVAPEIIDPRMRYPGMVNSVPDYSHTERMHSPGVGEKGMDGGRSEDSSPATDNIESEQPLVKTPDPENAVFSEPQNDDFGSPVKWVPFNSNETEDGLAKVTDPETGRNRQFNVNGTIVVPIIDYSLQRLGLTTEPPKTVKLGLRESENEAQYVAESVDFDKVDEKDWLAFESVLGSKERQMECEGEGCQSRCKKLACESVCAGDTCASGCVGKSCSAYCKGPGCLAMCIGVECQAKCDGLGCEARCRGDSCESKCLRFSCQYTVNGRYYRGQSTWEDMYPQFNTQRPEEQTPDDD
ncbi:hypothetical protein K1T71_013854 [Dendrolimus kikuchii]|uniref:Uncharacterized protein n=1 Tax=Dendrolimus kikuchii TaxID=765133 RepID=A0ACC1CFX3_9NEOP|nr:hypothetical protein K1T71_013854 [Dendrolimus kikuchii]